MLPSFALDKHVSVNLKEFLVGVPFGLQIRIVVAKEKRWLRTILIWSPVSANYTIVNDNGLEDTIVVMGFVLVFGWQHNVAALVANQVFIVRWH